MDGNITAPRQVWFDLAFKEMGQQEIDGPANNPRIVEYHKATLFKANEDAIPWCSSFVCWCFEQAGIESTKSAAAKSWKTWGVKLNDPVEGAVTIIRNSKTGLYHVGFFVYSLPETVAVLGGNQRDAVNITVFKNTAVSGYRWPVGVPTGQSG